MAWIERRLHRILSGIGEWAYIQANSSNNLFDSTKEE